MKYQIFSLIIFSLLLVIEACAHIEVGSCTPNYIINSQRINKIWEKKLQIILYKEQF